MENAHTEADDTLLSPRLCFFQLPAENNVVNQVDADAERRRERRREADLCQLGIRLNAHEIGNGQAHNEGLRDALQHDEQ